MKPLTYLTLLSLHFLLTLAQRVVIADIWRPDNATLTEISSNTTLKNSTLFASSLRRQSPFGAALTQKPDKSMYWINITVGTPGQHQSLQLDTGSRDYWIPATGSAICSSSLVDCGLLGSFTSSESSTFSTTGQANTISYSDGTSATGELFYDTVHIGGRAVTKQLGTLATTGTGVNEGVLGIGFPASAPTVNHNLAAQGIIASNSYSLYLDSISAGSGTILFGGLDKSKFVAPLLKIPVVDANEAAVLLTRVDTVNAGVTTVQTSSAFEENAVLDTGTTLTVLQTPLAGAVIEAMGAEYYPATATSGTSIIPCSQASKSLSINFHFSSAANGPTINVPIAQMVLQSLGVLNGVQMCQFGIYGSSDGEYPTTLGDSFLRSAYVVYDLDTNHIGMAQTVFNSGPANIVEIGPGGIPVGVSVGVAA